MACSDFVISRRCAPNCCWRRREPVRGPAETRRPRRRFPISWRARRPGPQIENSAAAAVARVKMRMVRKAVISSSANPSPSGRGLGEGRSCGTTSTLTRLAPLAGLSQGERRGDPSCLQALHKFRNVSGADKTTFNAAGLANAGAFEPINLAKFDAAVRSADYFGNAGNFSRTVAHSRHLHHHLNGRGRLLTDDGLG